MKKLKLYLEQIENTVVMRVLEQEGITENVSERVSVYDSPELTTCSIFLRGSEKKYDHKTCYSVFNTNEEANEYLNKVIGWLDDVFAKQVEPKRGDLVEVWDTEDYKLKRIFLAKIEEALFPFFCVLVHNETKFKNGEKFMTQTWKHMRQLTKTGYDPVTKTYYGELNND